MSNPDKKHKIGITDDGLLTFFPLHAMKELMVMLGILAALHVLAAVMPAHLKGPADPFNTPPHIKPEWYFLAPYQALKYFPAGEIIKGFSFVSLGFMLINGMIGVLFIVPFIDKYKHRGARNRPIFTIIGIVGLITVIILIYFGHYSGHIDPIFHRVFK